MVKNEKLKSMLQINKPIPLQENISRYISEPTKYLETFIDKINVLKEIKDEKREFPTQDDIEFLKKIAEKQIIKDLKDHLVHTLNFLENLKKSGKNIPKCNCDKKEAQNLHKIEEEIKENYEPDKIYKFINETLKFILLHTIKKFEKETDRLKKDKLTHTWTRICLYDDLKKIKDSETNKKENKRLFIAILDSDKLKYINDRFGHSAGDKVIEKISDITQKVVKKSGRIYRYGGDEFILIIKTKSQKEFLQICEKIRKKIERTKIKLDKGKYVRTTVSIGATEIKDKGIKKLFKIIDKNLYKAKRFGGNKIVFRW